MAEAKLMKATKRESVGTRFARREREAGLMPANISSKGKESLSVSLSAHAVKMELQHHVRVLNIDVEGKEGSYMIKEVQYDHLYEDVIHMDLNEVDPKERVKVSVELVLKGVPIGQTEGGVLKQVATEIEIEVPVISIPNEIVFIVAGMNVNDVAKANQLTLPQGVTLVSDPEAVLATLKVVEDSETPELADADAAPEVIGGAPEDKDEA